MPFPNAADKQDFDAIITPEAVLAYMRRHGTMPDTPPPRAAVICFSQRLLRSVAAEERTHTYRLPGPRGVLHLLEHTGGAVAVVGGFGFGAPATGMIAEDLIAYGVEEFIIVGAAGTLQPDCAPGDVVVCDKAIRDEGLSHHYLRPDRFALPSADLTERLATAVDAAGLPSRVGASWTIDAIYRETVDEARQYQQEGVCTVEMEAAGLFAVTSLRGVRSAAAFVITDSIAQPTWEPAFDSPAVPVSMRRLYEIAVEVLAMPQTPAAR